MDHADSCLTEVQARKRFRFGQNWRRFLSSLTSEKITSAQESLTRMLKMESLHGKSFVDVGSGSGLFSLAARRLGARVVSLDYDPDSVWCTNELRSRFFPGDSDWLVCHISILDTEAVQDLGSFDVVYSWGVLHHTGQMWKALQNTARLANGTGLVFLALYNDQAFLSRYWYLIKKTYNAQPFLRPLILAAHLPYLLGARLLVRLLTGRMRLERGMSYWRDAVDWLGGFPFEVARPEEVLDFLRQEDFELLAMETCGGRNGCNEYLFRRIP